ncbi:hypothetical protein [Terrarubrum flagellatum]|uniref:hypothetical protein n=1 Tax=Terrirubrum flagellatum TaxID=2895980 RepID=UPI003144D8F6
MSYSVFATTPATNSDHKNDATGAFIPGAQKFATAYGGSYRNFNNVGSGAKDNFLQTIKDGPGSLDMFAYFGHGWNNPPQLGSAHIFTEADMDQFAAVLREKLKPDGIIVLYACSAGSPNSFTTMLQEKVGSASWVYGHYSVGHSFANPDVSEVQQTRSPRYRKLFTGELRAAWSESLHYSDMWLRFPIMWDMYIERELNAIRLLGSWSVPGSGTYVFTWSKTNGTYDSLESINQNPSGIVKDQAGRKQGQWTIDDQIRITWDSGESEIWIMPVKPSAQPILGGAGFAVRKSHTLPGRGQT